MSDSISKRLSALVSMNDDSMDNPLANSTEHVSLNKSLSSSKEEEDDQPQKKKKKKSFSEKLRDLDSKVSEISQDSGYEMFDAYFDSYAENEEDKSLRNSLISQGRKYARQTAINPETSEIVRAFSGHEKNLQTLLAEVTADSNALQKDIDAMHAMRTGRNYKVLSDMQATKKEYHLARLRIVEGLSKITKDQIELQAKINKDKQVNDQNADPDMLINRAIGNMFGSGRSAALGSVGGYSRVSGAIGADETTNDEIENEDETDNVDYDSESYEGEDLYLKYENSGAHLILTEHEDHTYTVTAEDREGNVLPDYPLPPNADHLSFEVNERLGSARDDYHRKYDYRKDF